MSLVKTLKHHKLLLDTHILIWLASGENVFKSSFLKFLVDQKKSNKLHLSPISVWEVGILVEKKRIDLGMDRLEWCESAVEHLHLEILSISPRIAIQSTRLPGEIHGDPADRILISTAHESNAVLATCDEKILQYGKDRYLDVYNPCRA